MGCSAAPSRSSVRLTLLPSHPSRAAEPRALTPEEISRVNQAFAPGAEEGGVADATPASGFFTSYYDDVRELDFAAFWSTTPMTAH